MKNKILLIVCFGIVLAFSCKKNESIKQLSTNVEMIWLKNRKFYPKDSVFNKMSEYTGVPEGDLIYDQQLGTFFLKGYNLELDPIVYLDLK